MDTEALKLAREHNPRDPGKFEGEQAATVYYHSCTFPEAEAYDPYEAIFRVSPDEAKEFELTQPYYFIHERDDGFVVGKEFSTSDYADWRAIVESEPNEE